MEARLNEIEAEMRAIDSTLEKLPSGAWSDRLVQRIECLQAEIEVMYQSYAPQKFSVWKSRRGVKADD
jgi:hypothetical protein